MLGQQVACSFFDIPELEETRKRITMQESEALGKEKKLK